MGLFTPKPTRAMQAEYIRQADNVVAIFGVALQNQVTTPSGGQEPIDLTVQENRDAIRDELTRIMRDYELESCARDRKVGARLRPLILDRSKSSTTDAAVCSVMSIAAIDLIARTYYQDYPRYQPLLEMVDGLAKIGCTGAAQTIGSNLPEEVVRTWPYFSKIFEEAKRSETPLWPEV